MVANSGQFGKEIKSLKVWKTEFELACWFPRICHFRLIKVNLWADINKLVLGVKYSSCLQIESVVTK